jgi:multidrug efflux pump subunit AcrB
MEETMNKSFKKIAILLSTGAVFALGAAPGRGGIPAVRVEKVTTVSKSDGQLYVGKIVALLFISLLVAYLFLVAQYESWTMPVSVMLSVATATLGAILALKFTNIPLNIYCQLGLLMLIGLTAKTAILMVEFSKQERESGKSIEEAAMNGMKVRFRSVMMTALSFVIGVFPLVIASGAGAGSRQAVGVTTFWGMLVATVVGMMFIPGLYVIFQKAAEKVFIFFGKKQ